MPVGVELITFSLPCTLSVKADWCFLMTQNDWILSSSWADETFFSPQSVMWRKKLPTAAQTSLTFQPIACFCWFFLFVFGDSASLWLTLLWLTLIHCSLHIFTSLTGASLSQCVHSRLQSRHQCQLLRRWIHSSNDHQICFYEMSQI